MLGGNRDVIPTAKFGLNLGMLAFLLAALTAPAQAAKPDPGQTLRAMGLLKDNCLACHNPEKKKGKLILTTREGALAGGENGAVIVPGQSAASRLLAVLSPDSDPHMPPKGQLTPDEVATLRGWIESGAAWEQSALAKATISATRPVTLRALPASYHPILAMALAPDQKRLAVGRGDRILIVDVSSKDRMVLLELATSGDVVQSLAWSTDGQCLASGGFRRLRLWDAKSDKPARELDGFTGRVTALGFAGADRLIAGDEGGTVRIFYVKTGQGIAQWNAHDDSVLSLKISKDATLLATAG